MIRSAFLAAAMATGLLLAVPVAPAAAQAVVNPYDQLLAGKPALTLDEGRRVIAALRTMHESGLFTEEAMTDVEGMEIGEEGLAIVRDHGFTVQQWSDAMLKVTDGYYAVVMQEAGMGGVKSINMPVMQTLRADFEALQESMGKGAE